MGLCTAPASQSGPPPALTRVAARAQSGAEEQHVLGQGGVQKAHGAHPASRVHEHPLQVLVGQHVARVQPPQLHDQPREGQLVVQPWRGKRNNRVRASTSPEPGNGAPGTCSSSRPAPTRGPPPVHPPAHPRTAEPAARSLRAGRRSSECPARARAPGPAQPRPPGAARPTPTAGPRPNTSRWVAGTVQRWGVPGREAVTLTAAESAARRPLPVPPPPPWYGSPWPIGTARAPGHRLSG